MKHLLHAGCIAVLLATAAPLRADEAPLPRVVLRERAAVAGETFRLCDVASVPPGLPVEVRELSLGNSPWAGQVRRVTRGLVTLRLLAAGFDPAQFPLGGAEACVVERATTCVSADLIVAAAREHLLAQFPQDGPEVCVELLREVAPVLVPPAQERVELRPSVLGSAAPMGTVRVDVDLVRAGVRLRKVPLSFAVKVNDRIAVAARSIAVGEALTGAKVNFARRDVAKVGSGCFGALADLAGKVATRPIRPGQPITRRIVADAKPPYVIGLNQRVYIVLETPTLRAVTMGKSLCRARQGELARAKNLSTGREVVGVAAGDSTIRVTLEGQPDDS